MKSTSLIIILVVLVVSLFVSGCQTMHGLMADIENASGAAKRALTKFDDSSKDFYQRGVEKDEAHRLKVSQQTLADYNSKMERIGKAYNQ